MVELIWLEYYFKNQNVKRAESPSYPHSFCINIPFNIPSLSAFLLSFSSFPMVFNIVERWLQKVNMEGKYKYIKIWSINNFNTENG